MDEYRRIANFGVAEGVLHVEISIGGRSTTGPLEPSPDADQRCPRRSYVYAHLDDQGRIFYVGVGVRRRAWSDERHELWHRYVERHLSGQYRVLILKDDLPPDEAEDLEGDWISHLEPDLVNWLGREMDYEAIEGFHSLRNRNRELVASARLLEGSEPERAAQMYSEAVASISGYALMDTEVGLVGKLLQEETEELGSFGDISILDRATIYLVRLGRSEEAARLADDYFCVFRRDLVTRTAERVQGRVDKALARATGQRVPNKRIDADKPAV